MTGNREKLKVVIADDHPLVAFGLHKALDEAGCDVVGTTHDVSDLMDLLAHRECDILIADYSMPGRGSPDGWRFLSIVSREFPDLRILVYTEFHEPFLVGSLEQRGVAGIVSKSDEMSEVLTAVRELERGASYLSPTARAALYQYRSNPELQRFGMLTARQMEIAGLMLCGISGREIASLMQRRKSAISSQSIKVRSLLGFDRLSELHRFASNLGLKLDRFGPGDLSYAA